MKSSSEQIPSVASTPEYTISPADCQVILSKYKFCTQCEEWKDRSEFYAKQAKCKICNKREALKRYYENHEHNKKRALTYYHDNRKHLLIAKRKWVNANRKQVRLTNNKARQVHRERYPDREYARHIVNLARKHGLVLESCSWPGCTATENIEAAHDDYSKPHLIHELCRKHHRMWDYCKGELPFDLPVIDISGCLGRTKPTADVSQRVEVVV